MEKQEFSQNGELREHWIIASLIKCGGLRSGPLCLCVSALRKKEIAKMSGHWSVNAPLPKGTKLQSGPLREPFWLSFFLSVDLPGLYKHYKPIDRICAIILLCPWLQTHKHPRLVMTLTALCCTQQSRATNIDCCALEIWPWPVTMTPTFDRDLKAR